MKITNRNNNNLKSLLELKIQLETLKVDLKSAQDNLDEANDELKKKMLDVVKYNNLYKQQNEINMQLLSDKGSGPISAIHIVEKASCAVCMEFYEKNVSKRPVCFPCGHGLCISCATAILNKVVSECHICRIKVNKFITNFDLEKILI